MSTWQEAKQNTTDKKSQDQDWQTIPSFHMEGK